MKQVVAFEFRLVCAALLFIAIGFVAGALMLPVGSILAPGPGLVPLLLAGGLTVSTAAVALMPSEAANDQARPARSFWAVCAILAISIVFFERIGFLATIGAATAALLIAVERQPVLKSLLIAAALSGGSYLIFETGLHVGLP